MLFGISVIFFIIAYRLNRYYQSWLNPGSIFSALWGTIFILYSLRLFNIYIASNYTILIFVLGVVSFLLGCIPVRFSFGKKRLYHNYTPSEWSFTFDLRARRIFMLLSFGAVVILFIRAINTLPFWVAGVSAVKQANAEGYISYSSWVNILYTFFANPFTTLSVFVISVDFFFERGAFSNIQMILTVVMLMFSYISTGSKFSLFVPVMTFIIVYFYYLRERKQDTIYITKISAGKMITIGSAVIGICAFLIYMLSKKYSGWVESLYMYLVGCIPCGDNAINDMASEKYYYGMVSLNGVFRFISDILSFVGIKSPYSSYMNEAYMAMMSYEKAINISPTVKYNAFISAFSYFYRDGGVVGVVIGSLIFGRISHLVYQRLLIEKSAYSLLLYVYICYLILFSIVRMQLFLLPAVMVLIYLMIFFRKIRSDAKENY